MYTLPQIHHVNYLNPNSDIHPQLDSSGDEITDNVSFPSSHSAPIVHWVTKKEKYQYRILSGQLQNGEHGLKIDNQTLGTMWHFFYLWSTE